MNICTLSSELGIQENTGHRNDFRDFPTSVHIAESNDNELALLLHPNCWYLAAIATKDVLPPSLHDAADVSMHDATSKPKGGMVGCTCADLIK